MGIMNNLKTTRPTADVEEMEFLNHCICHGTSFLAAKLHEEDHTLKVYQDTRGFYLGCWDGGLDLRDSEYFPNREAAQAALDNHSWTQRLDP